jgi:gamma-glutamylputrescine oxidase
MKFEVFWQNPGYTVRPELLEDIECDYLIAGGGITGVSLAYFLARSGAKNIVLVEQHEIGSGATGKAAGTIVTRGERDLLDIMEQFGIEKGTLFWRETHAGLNSLRKIIHDEGIECDAETQDTLYCGFKAKTLVDLYKEYAAERSIEETSVFLEGADFKKELPTPLFTHGILSAKHALSVNPLKLVQGLSHSVEKQGVKIYENTALLRAADGVAETHRGDIRYKKLIWAIDADYPEDEIKNVKTTIIMTRPLQPEELRNIGFADRKKVVFDSRRNHNYFKVTAENRLLVGFGTVTVNKKQRRTDPHFPHLQQLQQFMKKIFPHLNLEAEYAWSGHFGARRHGTQKLPHFLPMIKVQGDTIAIAAAASQVVCHMAAQHVAQKLLGQPSALEGFFTDISLPQ